MGNVEKEKLIEDLVNKSMDKTKFDIHIKMDEVRDASCQCKASFTGNIFGKFVVVSEILNALHLKVDGDEFKKILDLCREKEIYDLGKKIFGDDYWNEIISDK